MKKPFFPHPIPSLSAATGFSASPAEARARRLWGMGLALMVVASGMTPSLPAGAAPKNGRAAKTPAKGESYILGAGDVLRVVVAGYPEFNQESVIIPPDGVVTLPRFGTLRLNGKTRLGVQRELTSALARNVGMRNPPLAVSITQFRSQVLGRVVLSGDVPRSGSFDVREGHRLSDLLADAGLQSRLEERRATLARRGSKISLNLKAAAGAPYSAADIVLRPGDSITVTQIKAGRITLQGDVPRTGVYELHPVPLGGEAMELGLAPRLSDLITKAGGLRSNKTSGAPKAAPSVIGNTPNGEAPAVEDGTVTPTSYTGFLQRNGKRLEIDPQAAISQVSGPANITLQSGDFVTIEAVVPPPPVQPITVYLDGSSTRTGSFQVQPGTGVLELITTAGGLTKAPNDIIASVRRGGQTLPLDLLALLLSSDSAANIKLESGDFVQLREPETIEIQVAGRVAKPGPQRLKPGSTILDALLASGGLAVPVEDARLNVLRKEIDGTQRVLQADAAAIVQLRDMTTNLALQNGDLVNIAQNAVQTVSIDGQVNSPTSLQLRAGEDLPELIIRAGGVKPEAALTRISVKRDGKVILVDAYDAIKAGKPLNFPLQDGDSVFVPLNTNRVLVMEAVAKPGYYPIPERGNLTLLDVLAQATPQQKTKEVQITRANPDGTINLTLAAKPQIVKLDDLRRGAGNIVLSPRDIVFVVPAKPGRSFLQTLSSLSILRLFLP